MATPAYAGNAAQPTANGGWLGGLGSWFGISTPAYTGGGQPAASSSGYFSGTTPAYKTPATQQVSPVGDPERITLVVPRELIPPGLIPQQP
jgi:hypothetical protein